MKQQIRELLQTMAACPYTSPSEPKTAATVTKVPGRQYSCFPGGARILWQRSHRIDSPRYLLNFNVGVMASSLKSRACIQIPCSIIFGAVINFPGLAYKQVPA